jgi:glutamate formiminotransferase/formiminotetrahydrofolate cyclodeaminase
VNGVELLDVDPGAETNRTVYTFVGRPDGVAEAAFRLVRACAQLIDMRKHKGAHSRIGAADVVPFVPVGGGATMDDCIELARRVGRRIGEELGIPVYLYERAASRPERRSLAEVRKGEYEGLGAKLQDPAWKPDFGPVEVNEKTGATIVGARPFLIAYNVDLNTQDKKLAHDIALAIREQGRRVRAADGALVHDDAGQPVTRPGSLPAVRAVGWYIPEFGRAQVSINLLDYEVTPPHRAFDEVVKEAEERGLRVTGSEIVGLTPLAAILMAGGHYLARQGRTPAVPAPDLVHMAQVSLGLSDVKPFAPEQAIIDYRLAPREQGLRARSVVGFVDELSRPSPAPGGGSASALVGALAAALSAMVAALTHDGGKTDASRRTALVDLGRRAQELKDQLLRAVDEDADAFERLRAARRQPKGSDEQKTARAKAIAAATRAAIDTPLSVVEAARDIAGLAVEAAALGLAAAASDAGVSAWCARAAAEGAALNVRINLPDLDDDAERSLYTRRLDEALAGARRNMEKAAAAVEKILG